jgi:hypothetical protein
MTTLAAIGEHDFAAGLQVFWNLGMICLTKPLRINQDNIIRCALAWQMPNS